MLPPIGVLLSVILLVIRTFFRARMTSAINKFIFNFRYVIGDLLLLVDVFEKYREMCRERMGLEALHYISLPSLTFDACLKLTKTKLEIIKDIDMVQMLESGIRGGLHLGYTSIGTCREIVYFI